MNSTMCKTFLWLFLFSALVSRVEAFDQAAPSIKAADFPSLAARLAFFEKRVNAADSRIREQVLVEADRYYHFSDKEYVTFLKRMMHDPDPGIRGKAIKKLHDMWVPLAVRELPQTFTGYSQQQILDLEDKDLIPELIAQCQRGGHKGGWAAYALGLLRCQEALPDLVKLGNDPNEFARYAAGRALLDCGAKKEAKAVFQKLMSHQFKPKAQKFEPLGYRHGEVDPYYVGLAARAFMELGKTEKKQGLRRLVTLLGELEPSKDVNDGNRVEAARWLVAEVTGQFFVSHREALDWLDQQEAAMGK